MKQKNDGQRILLILLGAIVMAMNIKIFVRAGDMFPGGFNGLTLLIQRTASEYHASPSTSEKGRGAGAAGVNRAVTVTAPAGMIKV